MQKKNTIGFEFGKNGAMPSVKDAITFVAKDLKIKKTDVHTVYRDPTENTFYVKFIDEEGSTPFGIMPYGIMPFGIQSFGIIAVWHNAIWHNGRLA